MNIVCNDIVNKSILHAEIKYMFEENEYVTKIEVALHERAEEDLLAYMNDHINSVLSKMDTLKEAIRAEAGDKNQKIDEFTGRRYYVFSLFINLWYCRN